MKLKPLLISLAAVSALAAGAANAAQVIVTTGAGYVKMVDALAALYQKETGVAVEKSFGGNIGQMLAQVKHGSGVNVVISDEASPTMRSHPTPGASATRRSSSSGARDLS